MKDDPMAPGDAYPPAEIAHRVQALGVAKARADALSVLVLSTLAGAFISLGAMAFIVVTTESQLGLGPTRLLGGLTFCLGLVLVVVAGAELFTGNNLIAMAWASRLIGTRELLRSWLLTYIGNVLGCLGTALLVLLAGLGDLGTGAVGETAISIAGAKAALPLGEAFVRGILCNALVCLAVWLVMGARSVTDKIVALIFPITAFVVLGLEHSIANWFFLPFGLALDQALLAVGGARPISPGGAALNLLVVTAGNIVGGTLLVAAVYWIAYLRGERSGAGDAPTDRETPS